MKWIMFCFLSLQLTKQLSFIYFANECMPKICWNENIEINIFFNNSFLINIYPRLNYDEIEPTSCVPTTYSYDSFIWFHDCQIQWQILFFASILETKYAPPSKKKYTITVLISSCFVTWLNVSMASMISKWNLN